MLQLRDYEQLVLSMLLAGNNPVLEVLRAQARVSVVRERERTPVGQHIYLSVPKTAVTLKHSMLVLNDVEATFTQLQHPVQVCLFVDDGMLTCLDFESVAGEDWPDEPTFSDSRYLKASLHPGGGVQLSPCAERDTATLAMQLHSPRRAA